MYRNVGNHLTNRCFLLIYIYNLQCAVCKFDVCGICRCEVNRLDAALCERVLRFEDRRCAVGEAQVAAIAVALDSWTGIWSTVSPQTNKSPSVFIPQLTDRRWNSSRQLILLQNQFRQGTQLTNFDSWNGTSQLVSAEVQIPQDWRVAPALWNGGVELVVLCVKDTQGRNFKDGAW